MSLQIGIVGLPNVGKSTLFNALTKAGAVVASYPFTTIEPNVGVVTVPDTRLEQLAAIVRPKEIKYTSIEFVDIAGLVKDAHRGEGLGNQFLGHIRNVDAVALVVRCFEDADIAHVTAELDPVGDCEVIDLELCLADLGTVERRVEKVQSMAKAQPREFAAELECLARLKDHLSTGQRASVFSCPDAESEWITSLNLLTGKPRLYIANVGESDLPAGGRLAEAVLRHAAAQGAEAVVLCAQLESDLADWPPAEAAEYREGLEVKEPGLERLISASYRLLNLITFFTATGTNVVAAWTLQRGQTALHAAGKIHQDMQRGFIRAEVVPFDDLISAGDLAGARERGYLRLEGREYAVNDGDIIHFRFSPAH
ncbi:MAG TPA: redox-regulated ATPase YchF [Anaerolineae bacterium]|nr:redox-regulated ATPase YchF [Anaerolineae bacterium]